MGCVQPSHSSTTSSQDNSIQPTEKQAEIIGKEQDTSSQPDVTDTVQTIPTIPTVPRVPTAEQTLLAPSQPLETNTYTINVQLDEKSKEETKDEYFTMTETEDVISGSQHVDLTDAGRLRIVANEPESIEMWYRDSSSSDYMPHIPYTKTNEHLESYYTSLRSKVNTAITNAKNATTEAAKQKWEKYKENLLPHVKTFNTLILDLQDPLMELSSNDTSTKLEGLFAIGSIFSSSFIDTPETQTIGGIFGIAISICAILTAIDKSSNGKDESPYAVVVNQIKDIIISESDNLKSEFAQNDFISYRSKLVTMMAGEISKTSSNQTTQTTTEAAKQYVNDIFIAITIFENKIEEIVNKIIINDNQVRELRKDEMDEINEYGIKFKKTFVENITHVIIADETLTSDSLGISENYDLVGGNLIDWFKTYYNHSQLDIVCNQQTLRAFYLLIIHFIFACKDLLALYNRIQTFFKTCQGFILLESDSKSDIEIEAKQKVYTVLKDNGQFEQIMKTYFSYGAQDIDTRKNNLEPYVDWNIQRHDRCNSVVNLLNALKLNISSNPQNFDKTLYSAIRVCDIYFSNNLAPGSKGGYIEGIINNGVKSLQPVKSDENPNTPSFLTQYFTNDDYENGKVVPFKQAWPPLLTNNDKLNYVPIMIVGRAYLKLFREYFYDDVPKLYIKNRDYEGNYNKHIV